MQQEAQRCLFLISFNFKKTVHDSLPKVALSKMNLFLLFSVKGQSLGSGATRLKNLFDQKTLSQVNEEV